MASIDTTGMGEARRVAALALVTARSDLAAHRSVRDGVVPVYRHRIAVLAGRVVEAERALEEAEAAFAAEEGGDGGA